MKNQKNTSKFYELGIDERLKQIGEETGLSADELAKLSGRAGLSETQADQMIENVVGIYALPLGSCPELSGERP